MIKEIIILSFFLLVVVSLTTAKEDLAKIKPAGEMDMMETAETKYKGSKGGGGGHYRGGGGYHGGGGGGKKGGGFKGGKGFKKG